MVNECMSCGEPSPECVKMGHRVKRCANCKEFDYVLLNRDWPVLPSMHMVPGCGFMICGC